jgi:divalent metal cation (Fe/Co/Zn/Cd) transporter
MSDERAGCLAMLAIALVAVGFAVLDAIIGVLSAGFVAFLVYKLMEMWTHAGG